LPDRELTRQWWNDQRSKYELFTSQLVIDEAAAGDAVAAQERLTYLDDLPLLDIQHPEVSKLADQLIADHLLPRKHWPMRGTLPFPLYSA